MKRLIYFLFLIIILQNCSFDNKTGIWKDAREVNEEVVKDEKLIDVFVENKVFEEEKNIRSDVKIEIEKSIKNLNWPDEYFNLNNNISNINYKNNKILVSKIFKLSKFRNFIYNSDNLIHPLIYNEKIIFSNNRGTIYVYSLKTNKKVFEFNFYKKRYKKYKKEIYLLIYNGVIFAADNLGYSYAINTENRKIVWAKNFGVPFRSNIKIANKSLFLSNQDNELFSLDVFTGKKNWQFPTTPQVLKSKFINNILVDTENNNVLFLNNNGELYSINYINQTINWFKSFKKSSISDNSDLFVGTPISLKDNNIVFSSGNTIRNLDKNNGSIIWDKYIFTKIKPVLTNNNTFLITDNQLLVCLDNKTGDVVWSKNIVNQSRKNMQKSKYKKLDFIKTLLIVDSKIFLFSNEGYLLTFNIKTGDLLSLNRILKKKLGSKPIFSEGHMYLFDKSFKLLKFE